jgi:hypothetical protein
LHFFPAETVADGDPPDIAVFFALVSLFIEKPKATTPPKKSKNISNLIYWFGLLKNVKPSTPRQIIMGAKMPRGLVAAGLIILGTLLIPSSVAELMGKIMCFGLPLRCNANEEVDWF